MHKIISLFALCFVIYGCSSGDSLSVVDVSPSPSSVPVTTLFSGTRLWAAQSGTFLMNSNYQVSYTDNLNVTTVFNPTVTATDNDGFLCPSATGVGTVRTKYTVTLAASDPSFLNLGRTFDVHYVSGTCSGQPVQCFVVTDGSGYFWFAADGNQAGCNWFS